MSSENRKTHDNIDARGKGIAVGSNFGDVQNDNKIIAGNRIMDVTNVKNITVHKYSGGLIAIIGITIIAILLAGIILLLLSNNSDRDVDAANGIEQKGQTISGDYVIEKGSRGGYYLLYSDGKKKYINRKTGAKLYQQQEEKKQRFEK